MNWCGLSSFLSHASELGEIPVKGSQTTIRKAQLQDVKKLAEVLTQSFHPHSGRLSVLQPLLQLSVSEDLRSRLRTAAPHYCCLVAIEIMPTVTGEPEKVIGTIELTLKTGLNTHYPYISNLAVLQSHRRQGVARHLLLKCEQIAWEWGYKTLNLHVLDNNDAAKQLYLASGYQLLENELSWQNWLFQSPRRLLLQKTLTIHEGETCDVRP
ncbi:GNAT family N-acetyltransferase [Crocosphaera sp. UHCC 0190]|uniref:GNAT family N-acetyltransferase n=1 Tax=Crocosphaera sp. UHCC 0190 TaxID=3110246 RepID=UPI002B21053C|nr:GNAT family N-acetyltransferase [Crocosphaera sp. UHCC 0190]MEA5508383.1 GNAT family N-acetyltransferase [Crocosphaera sp. UHCC 0190]